MNKSTFKLLFATIIVIFIFCCVSQSIDNDFCDADSCSEPSNLNEINVMITFYNAKSNPKLIKTFTTTVNSLLHHSSVPLAIHIIGDESSQNLAADIISKEYEENKHFRVSDLHEAILVHVLKMCENLCRWLPWTLINLRSNLNR